MSCLTQIIEQVKASNDFDGAISLFGDYIIENGFSSYIFSQMNTINSPAEFQIKYYKSTFPDDWVTVYRRENLLFNDPIAKEIMYNTKPFYWSEHIQSRTLCDKGRAFMDRAKQYGLVDGIGCSYLKNKGNLYTLSVAKTSPIESYDYDLLGNIYLLGSYLINAYEGDFASDDSNIKLSKQERTILNYAAIGKTDSEIAIVIGLSVNTVRYHWKNIFEKLDSYNRVFAIIRAINSGLISLEQYNTTTEDGSVQTYVNRA